MGLGKTIHVLSLLLVLKRDAGGRPGPSLLVAPASLLANWISEIERFAPGLRTLVAHPSAMPAAEFRAITPEQGCRLGNRVAGLDEAQAIKNPNARQTRAVKTLKARARVALCRRGNLDSTRTVLRERAGGRRSRGYLRPGHGDRAEHPGCEAEETREAFLSR